MAPRTPPANRSVGFKTNLLKGSILRVQIDTVGSFWDWAEQKTEQLFNRSKTALSDDFIANVQPLLDSLALNVSLPRVKIVPGAGTNQTDGYNVGLMSTDETFSKQLGILLHEIGHIVQFVNAPRAKWQHKKKVTIKKDGQLQEIIVSDWDAKILWMREENTQNASMNVHLYRDEMPRYDQDAYIRDMPLAGLVGTKLLVLGYSLDAPCNRFSDLLRCWHATPHR